MPSQSREVANRISDRVTSKTVDRRHGRDNVQLISKQSLAHNSLANSSTASHTPLEREFHFLPKKYFVCLPSHLGFDEITLARTSFNANRVCEKNSRKTETIIEDNRIFSARRENKENCSGPNVGCESRQNRVKTQTFGFVGKFCVHYRIYRGHNVECLNFAELTENSQIKLNSINVTIQWRFPL